MKQVILYLTLLITTAGCMNDNRTQTNHSSATDTNITTVTVSGQAYDVYQDPYDTSYAIIFGKRKITNDYPKAEIIAAATHCVLDHNTSMAMRSTDMIHPTRPDLDNLGWVPVDCSQA